MAQISILNKDQYNIPLSYKGRESTLITQRDIQSFWIKKERQLSWKLLLLVKPSILQDHSLFYMLPHHEQYHLVWIFEKHRYQSYCYGLEDLSFENCKSYAISCIYFLWILSPVHSFTKNVNLNVILWVLVSIKKYNVHDHLATLGHLN